MNKIECCANVLRYKRIKSKTKDYLIVEINPEYLLYIDKNKELLKNHLITGSCGQIEEEESKAFLACYEEHNYNSIIRPDDLNCIRYKENANMIISFEVEYIKEVYRDNNMFVIEIEPEYILFVQAIDNRVLNGCIWTEDIDFREIENLYFPNKEVKNMSKSLKQDWFCKNNMIMFNEYFEKQAFFDIKSKCIYIVKEIDNTIMVKQLDKDNENYNDYYVKYVEFCKKNENKQKIYSAETCINKLLEFVGEDIFEPNVFELIRTGTLNVVPSLYGEAMYVYSDETEIISITNDGVIHDEFETRELTECLDTFDEMILEQLKFDLERDIQPDDTDQEKYKYKLESMIKYMEYKIKENE